MKAAVAVLFAATAARAQLDSSKQGVFGFGLSAELALGAYQAAGPGGVPGGAMLGGLLQYDVDGRWSVRLPVQLGIAAGGGTSFLEFSLTPGGLYHLRDTVAHSLIPYVGAGLKLGVFSFGRPLLGLPPTPDGDTTFDKAGVAPELWGGVEWRVLSFFSLDLGLTYSYFRVARADLHVWRESLGLRVSI